MTILQRLAQIQTSMAALVSLPATLSQIATDIAQIKAAQQQSGAQALDDIKAIVINIQSEIGSE